MRPVVLGVDIGSSNAKCVAFDEARPIAAAAVGYELRVPEPGAAEQDPVEVSDAVVDAVARVVSRLEGRVVSLVGFSAAMHSLLPIDAEGVPLMQALTYADTRSRGESEWLLEHGGDIYSRTGTPLHPMSPVAKLRWLSVARPDVVRAARRFVSLKDWILWQLTGRLVTDHSIASASGLFNLRKRSWDTGALEAAGISADLLPDLVPTTHVLGPPTPEVARRTGLPPHVLLVVGASDGVLANVGAGAAGPGALAVSVGTSGALRTVVDAPATDPDGATFCYALTEDRWVVGGPVSNGGVVLRWLRDNFGAPETERRRDPYAALDELAASVPAGAGGLLFAPYLTGERAPFWDADARGALVGLTLAHRKAHVVRAAMEGVAFSLALVRRSLEPYVPSGAVVHATGGFTTSPLWLEIVASALDAEIVVPDVGEASCLGAAWLARVAVEDAGLDDVGDAVVVSDRVAPHSEAARAYARLLPTFAALHPRLAEQFRELADFERAVPGPGDQPGSASDENNSS